MDEEAVKNLIATAMEEASKPGGKVYQAIVDSFAAGQAGAQAVDVSAASASTRAVSQALLPAGEITAAISKEFDQRADAEYPYRAKLRSLTTDQWSAAWRNLVVEAGAATQAADAVAKDPAMANVLALQAAHPQNPELLVLKSAATLKYAARLKWKPICLPSFGGGSDRLPVFLQERADSQDSAVKALARSFLHVYSLLEKRHTVAQAAKKDGPAKAAEQRAELMDLVCFVIKSHKTRTTKASANSPLDTEIMVKDFGVDVLLGEAALAARGVPQKRPAAADRGSGSGGPSPKAARAVEPGQQPLQTGQPAQASLGGGDSTRTTKKQLGSWPRTLPRLAPRPGWTGSSSSTTCTGRR
ncbi:unnamed protein product [Prorocentrum cordatum]|uniref:Uncharacterized protein n=1 Tax=Prorocentrum cordatum TaxID=2364126 RepID=A0ABN9SPT0_9DINO|nr:unnamed protein product [Polarella glacialis]